MTRAKSKSEVSASASAWARALGLSICCYDDQWSWENGANERYRWYDWPAHENEMSNMTTRKARKRNQSSPSDLFDWLRMTTRTRTRKKIVKKYLLRYFREHHFSSYTVLLPAEYCLSVCLSIPFLLVFRVSLCCVRFFCIISILQMNSVFLQWLRWVGCLDSVVSRPIWLVFFRLIET